MTETAENQSTELQIRFVTTQEQYSVPDVPFAVQSKITCKELNKLINQLLKESADADKYKGAVDFDFLVSNQLLRTPLGKHIAEHKVSSESVIDVEYIERLPAPQPKDCLLHDDWVSSVHIFDKWILSGCFDNTVHIWNSKGKHQLTIPGHTASVKAVSWISNEDNISTFVSGSHDQTALLWRWNVEENVVENVRTCEGHTNGIECVRVCPNSTRFASGGLDNMLKVWSTSLESEDIVESQADGQSSPKKSKKTTKGPLVTLKGHKEGVVGLSWKNDCELVTASLDHSLRIWDTEVGTTVSEIAGNKAFLDVDFSPLNGCLITASTDKNIRLYDNKSSDTSTVKTTFSSHSLWVKTVKWSTTNHHLFISGSYDNQVKMWDTRSPQVPLFDLTGHGDKVLCCDWTDPSLIISGGSDNTVRIYKTKNISGF